MQRQNFKFPNTFAIFLMRLQACFLFENPIEILYAKTHPQCRPRICDYSIVTRRYSEKMRVFFFSLQESTIPIAYPFFESLLKTDHISILTQCDFTSTMLVVCLCGRKELSVEVFRFLAKSTIEKSWISFEWQTKTCIISCN